MFQKRMLMISTSIAVVVTVASQASADVTIIHNADGGTQVQAGKVRVSTGADGGAQVETDRIRLSNDSSFFVSRRYKPRRSGKPTIPTVKFPNTKIPSIPVVRSPNLRIPAIPTTAGVPTVIQRNDTYNRGGVYSTRTSTRSSNGSSSNSQSTVIRGNGQSHTNSNDDFDD